MALTPKQLSMYRAEFGKVRQVLRRIGVSPKDADAARMVLHARAGVTYKDGTPKSSSDLTNADLTKILAAFWVYTCPRSNQQEAQLRQLDAYQDAAMGKWSCERIYDLIREIDPQEVSEEGASAYIDGIFYNQTGGRRLGGSDPRTGTADQWHKVFLTCCYRYDQIVRRMLGEGGSRYGARFWPYNHARNLATLRAAGAIVTPPVCGFAATVEPVYTGPKNDDPF